LFENHRTVVPTTAQYIAATGKEALALLQSAASVIPVPLLKEAIGVAVKIIEVCEVRGILHGKSIWQFTCGYQETSAVQQNVKELQERVGHLMIILVDNVTLNCDEGNEVVVKTVKGIEKDITELLKCVSYPSTIVNLLSMIQHSEYDQSRVDRSSQPECVVARAIQGSQYGCD
jgi:hypothetical protein